jgi:DNA invertase Pin-like site-specific DNA recombinase
MIYGYIRVSTDQQDTDNQKIGINDKAKLLGVSINEWISDDGISGAKEPEDRLLGKLLKKIKQDDVIIASEISRLGRKLFMVMRILEHCMKIGVKVYTVKDGYELGDNIQSKVLAFAFGLAAEIERQMIQMRTKEGLANKKLQGVLLGNSRTKNINPHTPKDTIAKMKELLDKGYSLSTIADKTKTHRLTVAYHLFMEGHWKGQIVGFKLTMKSGDIVDVSHKTCTKIGLNYGILKESYRQNDNRFAVLGVEKIEPIHNTVGNFKESCNFQKSTHPKIDRSRVFNMVNDCLTIPEIHKALGDEVGYFEVYDFVAADTEISMLYRGKGHLRVKSKRE